VRNWAYAQLQKVSPAHFKNTDQTVIMARLLNDINALYSAYGELSNLTWLFLPIIPSMIFMVILSWRLGLLIFLITVLFVPLLRYGGILFYGINREIFEQVEDLNAHVLKSLDPTQLSEMSADPDVRAHAQQAFAHKNQRLADLGLTSSVIRGWFSELFGLHYSLITVLLWLIGGLMIIHGQLLLGTLVAVMAYAGKIDGFGGAFGVYLVVRTMQANADRVFALIDSLPDSTPSRSKTSPSAHPGGEVVVQNLQLTATSPQYDWVQPESTVYAVDAGAEGNFLLESLAGLREPSSGYVELPPRVALITADTPIPQITPAEILRVAAANASLSDEKIRELLHTVHLDAFDPNTPIPEGITSDDIRRLALAQALVQSPEVILTDREEIDGQFIRTYFPEATIVTLWSGDQMMDSHIDAIIQPTFQQA
jgi:ABC-type transport system involved in cytochrome bd biosynthesis fused ATPase/permease subunit